VHELSVATALLERCENLDAEPGATRVARVRVAVGELSSVDPELLRLAWEALVADGPHRGARLEVDWCPARQTCAACGEVRERQPGTWLRLCPNCGAPLRVAGGDELDLLQVEFAGPGESLATEESRC